MHQSGEQHVERELFCIYHIFGKNDEYKEIKKRGRILLRSRFNIVYGKVNLMLQLSLVF